MPSTSEIAKRRFAQLAPSAAWAGHAEPVTGDVRSQLELAATARVGGS